MKRINEILYEIDLWINDHPLALLIILAGVIFVVGILIGGIFL